MRPKRTGRTSMPDEVAAFLAQRGAPDSSTRIAMRFLRTREMEEGIATRLLRPSLEAAGLVYEDGAGWCLPRDGSGSESPGGMLRVGAAFDPRTMRLVLHPEEADLAKVTPVMLDPRQARGIARAGRIVSLRSCLRGRIRMKRGATLSDICGLLGVRWLDSGDPPGEARAIAACLSAAGVAREECVGEDSVEGAAALPAGIAAEDLARLPKRAGVYRFFDQSDALLYVGKAVNLKRRVMSYFTPRSLRAPRPFQSGIHRLEFTETGSELAALLAEARQITRRRPRGNIQRDVRERGRRYESSRCFALLLDHASSGTVSMIVVKEGRYLGHARLGLRGGGRGAAHRLLDRVMAETPRRRVSPGDDEILNSWLARNGEAARRLDLDSCRSVEQALSLLEAAIKDGQGRSEPRPCGERLRPRADD